MLQFLLGVEGALREWMVCARCALLPVQQPHVQRSLQLFCGSLLRPIFEAVEPESFAYVATYIATCLYCIYVATLQLKTCFTLVLTPLICAAVW